ncbi:tetratricopeptide repeat protein [Sulfoacidibacillus thermotolerans]|uniref:Uncharacterized protein n=1 Tax=Sulfoacidibacillus thermotolerans TaxID=1765684 RepID=A0A2U3D7P2_SULT2|nr:tetratricopeptide repeat protein [Sulfoacidibacillus thermotolerans]PWI57310.1 hypothetical protein BM613_09445 [Sulfoacidibacillus thermotolerans]
MPGVKQRIIGIGAVGLITALTLSGCGTSPSTTAASAPAKQQNNVVVHNSTGGESLVEGGAPYSGAAKLKQFETTAKNQPQNEQAQINAAISANINGKPQLAIQYYQKAIQIAPKDAIPYNNIGNIYYRTLNQPQKALPYYVKATQVNPSYAYGWWNLALCQGQLKDVNAEKQTLTQALKVIPPSNSLYSVLKQLQATVNGTK